MYHFQLYGLQLSAEKATTLLADMAYCYETFAWHKLSGLLIFNGAAWLPVMFSLYIITTTFEGTNLSVDAFCLLGMELRMPGRSPLRLLISGFRAAFSHFGWAATFYIVITVVLILCTIFKVTWPFGLTVSIWILSNPLEVTAGQWRYVSGDITFFDYFWNWQWLLSFLGILSVQVDFKNITEVPHL